MSIFPYSSLNTAEAFPHPTWCRRDLCDEVTPGREIDHLSDRIWQRPLDGFPDRRIALSISRRDRRIPGGPVVEGQLEATLDIDHWEPMSSELGAPGTWLPTGESLYLSLADLADLGRHAGDIAAALLQRS